MILAPLANGCVSSVVNQAPTKHLNMHCDCICEDAEEMNRAQVQPGGDAGEQVIDEPVTARHREDGDLSTPNS